MRIHKAYKVIWKGNIKSTGYVVVTRHFKVVINSSLRTVSAAALFLSGALGFNLLRALW